LFLFACEGLASILYSEHVETNETCETT